MNTRTTLLACLIAAATATADARADTFSVVNTADSGIGSLRAAVALANANPGHDTIALHPSLAGTIVLDGAILVDDPVTIAGAALGQVTISGNGFTLQPGTTDLILLDLEFVNCGNTLFLGTSVRITVNRCVFKDNGNFSGNAGVFSQGIATFHRLSGELQSCSFINNRGINAGVIAVTPPFAGDSLEFVNCTFDGNSGSMGAGVCNIGVFAPANSGTIDFTSCTITGNTGGSGVGMPMGAIHLNQPVPGDFVFARVRNSIVADNTAGTPVAIANFTGFSGQGLQFVGANIFSDPQLDPVQQINHRYVRIPMPGSPCIDAAATNTALRTDQLGSSRPFLAPGAVPASGSDGADIGAIEYVPAPCPADFDRSGAVSVPDIFAFLTAWFAGCP